MRLLFGSFLAFLVAACLGLGATWFALTRGTAFGAVTIGAWTAWPRTGSADIDPYARAGIARTGELPIGLGDGIAFFARSDDARRPFDGRCDVVVKGTTPPARFWTITLYDPEGRLIANLAEIYYIPMAPHNVCGPLGTLASCHCCAAIPNFLVLEWHWVDRPYWDELLGADEPIIQNGSIALPDRPGLGFELNEECARRYLRPETGFFD